MDTNIKYLLDNGINIWNKDAFNRYCERYNTTPYTSKVDGFFTFEEFVQTIKNKTKKHPVIGDLGRVYGAQWRAFGNGNDFIGLDDSTVKYLTIDQLSLLLHNLKNNPLSSEHIVTFQNPMDKGLQALPPCHKGFQLMVYELTLEERAALGSWKLGQTISELHCDLQNIPKYGFDLVWEQRSVDTGLG